MAERPAFLLGDFVRLLRTHGVRISPGESLEAGRALSALGFDSRPRVKAMLGQVLAKSAEEKAIFADCFERYFAATPLAAPDMQAADTPRQRQRAGQVPAEPPPNGALDEEDMVDIVLAADAVGLRDAHVFTQQGLFIRRVMDALGATAPPRSAPSGGRGSGGGAGRDAALFAAVRAHVEREIRLRTAPLGQRLREEMVRRTALNRIEKRDYELLQEVLRKWARRLASRLAARRAQARRGQLDLRRTLRHNYAQDGMLWRLHWRRPPRRRTKLLVLCDVSGSVASWSKFLLMMLYGLRALLPQTRAFVFSSACGEVTDMFRRRDLEPAMEEAMRRYGGSSDYGRALNGFAAACEERLTRQSTIVILGDARANYADPGHKVLARLSRAARAVYWLNPEPRSLWDTGDSEMRRMQPHCRQVMACQNLRELEAACERFLLPGR